MALANKIKSGVERLRRRVAAYIDPRPEVTDAGEAGDDIMPLDYPDMMKAGLEYADLIGRPGWTRMLDDLERRADERLGTLREAIHADNRLTKVLVDRWRESEETIIFVQNRASQAIEQRKQVIEEMAIKAGIGVGLDDDTLQDQRMRDYMGVEGVGQRTNGLDHDFEQYNVER